MSLFIIFFLIFSVANNIELPELHGATKTERDNLQRAKD